MMSADEVRYWLDELPRRGWSVNVLGRCLGIFKKRHSNLRRKAAGKDWLRGGERRRMSRQIERILAGELVCVPGRVGAGNKGKTIIAVQPQPLIPPVKRIYDLKTGRIRWVERDRPPPLRVPW